MLRVAGCAVRLHLRVERVGRESTLFLKNFDVAQGAENTLFRRGNHVMIRGIPELETERMWLPPGHAAPWSEQTKCGAGPLAGTDDARMGLPRKQEQERFIARRGRETMGRRSSLRDPAHTNRAEEKAGSLRSE